MVATSQQSGHDIVPSDRLLFPRTGQKLVVGGQSGVGEFVVHLYRPHSPTLTRPLHQTVTAAHPHPIPPPPSPLVTPRFSIL